MSHPSGHRPAAPTRLLLPWAFLVCAACVLAPLPAAAQFVRPWVPPAADSLLAWSAEARTRFQANTGDSANGANYPAYDLVGRMGRRLLRSLGRDHLAQASAIESVLDSLGLDTEVTIDPTLPQFVLLMVRNPFRRSANAVGFLYWVRGDDLRFQGILFRGGVSPKIRVWWTAREQAPYECGILDQRRDEEKRMGLLFLRLNPNGFYWNIVQHEGNAPDLGRRGEAFWVDANGDRVPEIVSWTRGPADSSFEECAGCPHLIIEKIFVRHEEGFELHDSRLLPSPYSSFVLFIRLLREQNRDAARRLLKHPAKLEEALALGWGAARGIWRLEYAEPDEAWPRWLALRFQDRKGRRFYSVHFTMRDARWIIDNWAPVTERTKSPVDGAQGK